MDERGEEETEDESLSGDGIAAGAASSNDLAAVEVRGVLSIAAKLLTF